MDIAKKNEQNILKQNMAKMLHENHDGHKDEHLNRRQIRARKSPLMMRYEAGTKLPGRLSHLIVT